MYDKDNYKPTEEGGRTTGERQTAISISTAIALESIAVEETIADVIFMNVTTLFRNFWGSWNNLSRPSTQRLLPIWKEELENIKAFIESMGIPAIFYKPSYDDLPKYWPDSRVINFKKIASGDGDSSKGSIKKKVYYNTERVCIRVASELEGLTIYGTGLFLPPIKADTFIITHHPIDLLAVNRFSKLALLETHTAEIKTFADFRTKLKLDNPRIGFNHFTLNLYGDKGGKMFRGLGVKFTRAVNAIAEDRKWNPTTTLEKIESDIKNHLVEKELAEVLLRIVKKKPLIPAPIVLN